MIDTTTVNYALDKMADAYKAIAPTVGQISEKYVMYAVSSQVVSAFVAGAGFLASLLMVYLCARWFKTGVNTHDEVLQGFGITGGVVFALIAMSLGVLSLFEAKDAVIAVLNPEMYAIEHLIQSVKK